MPRQALSGTARSSLVFYFIFKFMSTITYTPSYTMLSPCQLEIPLMQPAHTWLSSLAMSAQTMPPYPWRQRSCVLALCKEYRDML